MKRPSTAYRLSLLSFAVIMAGCTIQPEALSPQQRAELIKADQSHLYQDQEPVSGPLTLQEAIQRAERYNLDHRLQKMQRVLEDRQLDLAHFDMLPSAMAQAGYMTRDEDYASTSMLLSTGAESAQPSTSVEKSRNTRGLAFSWNILDFGVSYYAAKQSANRVLMAEEKRRRVLQSLTQDVRTAFWQAYAAQESEPEVQQLLTRVNQALNDAERIERERLMPPAQILGYRKSLIEHAQQLEALQGNMIRARVRLAAIINANPAIPITLVADTKAPLPPLESTPTALEARALENRPELIEAHYETRNAALEAKKLLARLLPGIEFGAGYTYDSNKYLVNNEWYEGSMQISWNLLNILRYSDQKAYAEAQEEVVDAKRLALTMAVIAQVHVAWHDYKQALHQYDRMSTLAQLEEAIRAQVAANTRESAGSQLDDIRAASALVLARLQARESRARANEAHAMLQTSLGGDLTSAPTPTPQQPDAANAQPQPLAPKPLAPASEAQTTSS